MKELGGGAIVNLGSIIWRLKQTGLPAYIASKAVVTGLTRTLARQLGPFGIRVNTISPGADRAPDQTVAYAGARERDCGRAVSQYAGSTRRYRLYGAVPGLGRWREMLGTRFCGRRGVELAVDNS